MRSSTLLACFALVACSTPQPEPPADADYVFHACSAGVDIDTSGWQTVEEGDFSFRLPPGFSDDSVQGIDSQVRQWSDAGGRMISYDYGAYSSAFEEFRQNESPTDCVATIGGREARVAAARGFPGDPVLQDGWVVGVSWRDVRDARDMPSHLSIFGAAPDTAGAAELLAAMRTTIFHVDE